MAIRLGTGEGINASALSGTGKKSCQLYYLIPAEFSGSDTIVHLAFEFGAAVLLVEGIHEFSPDERISVSIDTSRLMFFSTDGENISERLGNG